MTQDDWIAAGWTILVGALGNASCAILGCYLVLRRLSLLGDAISHAILPGVAIAFLFSGKIAVLPMFLGAVTVGLLTALFTQMLSGLGNVPEDTSMGVVFTSLFAVGVVLITKVAPDIDLDPGCVLYGLIEFVPLDLIAVGPWEVPRALQTLGPMLIVTVAFVAILWKELKIVTFDPALATAMGFSAVVIHYALMAMVAAVTVASFEAVGSILVIAMLIVPASTAHLLTDRLSRMLVISVIVGVLSAVLGYAGAVFLNTSVAGMMAVAAGVQFALAVVLAPQHGLLAKLARRLSLGLRIRGEDVLASLYRVEESRGLGATLDPRAIRSADGGGLLGAWSVQALRRKRLVEAVREGLRLTEAGRARALELIRAHRLWESYLGENFDLPLDHLHEPASRIEHFVGPELRKKLETGLAGVVSDPHGRVIPSPDQGSP